jgi:calcium-dependent protein kinase
MGCSSSRINLKEDKPHKTLIEKEIITKADDIKIQLNSLITENKGSIQRHYILIGKIGSGTFGKVYKVQHIPTQQIRAMKLVKRDTVNYQDDNKKFLKEIEMLSNLDHPNIIKIYEYFVDDLNYYVITELATGGELYDKIAKLKHYSEHEAAIIMKQLLSAVCYTHSKGIVHRDLKPENILLESDTKGDLNIKLIDFGTSNYYERNKKANKLTLKVGTPYYIAPEVLKKDYNNKCDMWSCGVIMYLLLSGQPPFDGIDEQSIFVKVKEGNFSFSGKEWRGISEDAKDLITNLLTYNYKNRIDAEAALKHNWIVKYSSRSVKINDLQTPFQNLRKFGAKLKLQQATIAFLVHHVSNSEMITELKTIFKELDENGDGTLSYDEIKNGFKKYYKNEKIAEKELEEIIKKIDQDNNEYIEYEEFIRATVNLDTLLTEENLKLAFGAFDKDNSGVLDAEEIKIALGLMDSDENDIIKEIINEIDQNGDGSISFEEFKNMMVKVLQEGGA